MEFIMEYGGTKIYYSVTQPPTEIKHETKLEDKEGGFFTMKEVSYFIVGIKKRKDIITLVENWNIKQNASKKELKKLKKIKREQKRTSVKVDIEDWDNFQINSIKYKLSFKDLTTAALYLFNEDEEFRKQINKFKNIR